MRGGILVFGLLVAELASAQSVLDSARGELGGKTSTTSGGVPVIQTIFAVLIVIGLLKLVLPRLMPHLAKSKIQTSLGSTIAVEETATLPGGQLMVVKVRGRSLLIGQTTANMTLIADLTAEEATAMQEPAFFELVDKAPGTMPTHAVIPENANVPTPAEQKRAADKLDRLNRLIGR
ncbi:MAG: flagellar biosynthetic protein FliO [Chthonomonas sp.]|nr:flagellar biosynthetic protein FliO [Chthonomonas sp.]